MLRLVNTHCLINPVKKPVAFLNFPSCLFFLQGKTVRQISVNFVCARKFKNRVRRILSCQFEQIQCSTAYGSLPTSMGSYKNANKQFDEAYKLANEAIPQLSTDLLADWEAVYKITDDSGTLDERRAALAFIIENRNRPRSFAFLKEFATFHGATITLENVDANPWSGAIGVGRIGLMTIGNVSWGGVVVVTALNLVGITMSELIDLLEPQIYASCIIEWVDLTVGDLIMRLDDGDDNTVMRMNGTDGTRIMTI